MRQGPELCPGMVDGGASYRAQGHGRERPPEQSEDPMHHVPSAPHRRDDHDLQRISPGSRPLSHRGEIPRGLLVGGTRSQRPKSFTIIPRESNKGIISSCLMQIISGRLACGHQVNATFSSEESLVLNYHYQDPISGLCRINILGANTKITARKR